jgi:hypothetical protein
MMDSARADGSRRNGHERDVNGARSRFEESRTMALLRAIVNGISAMAQDESALLRSELRDTGKSYASAAAAGVLALIMAGALVNFLGLAAVAGLLAVDVPLWAAALICAAAIALIAVGAVAYAVSAVRDADPVPRRTINNLRRDFQAMRDALRQEGNDHGT